MGNYKKYASQVLVRKRTYILLFGLTLLLFGCTEHKQLSSRTLTLSLSKAGANAYVVSDYEVRSTSFVKGQQQGRYQAHIYGTDEKIIHRINFEKVTVPPELTTQEGIELMVSLPMVPEAKYVKIYQLDGRSGHYQLNSEKPLLEWTIPSKLQ